MRRLTTIVVCAAILLCIGVTIFWFARMRSPREFRLGDDLQYALGVLNRVRLGESRCYRATGHFAPLQDLGPKGCGGLEPSILTGTDDGFTVEVGVVADGYSVKVHPANTTRLHSLYLDETGAVHFGTRDWPAAATSPLLVPHY